MKKYIFWFSEISKKDTPLVGGKNASLGEMFSKLSKKGINVPNGFAITSEAFRYYLSFNKIDQKLKEIFAEFNPKNIESLKKTGIKSRQLILRGKFPPDLEKEIFESYQNLSRIYKQKNLDVAVRSSATAEDLATASFAGQHESYINISGFNNLLSAVKKCFASLFTDRAIAYREEKGFEHLKVALSVCVQKMVRSDLASSGVMFTLDTETGFENVVLINSIFGQGEMIVQGKIVPDTFYVFKPTLKEGYKAIIRKDLGRKDRKLIYKKGGGLKEVKVPSKDQVKFSLSDEEILTLAKWAVILQEHYGCHQDIEWAKDGKTNQLFIVQSRPETVHGSKKERVYQEYEIKTTKKPILTGIAVGNKIGQGKVHVIEDVSKISQFKKGEVLVTRMTDPDWVPIMRIASAIVTDEGGRTCHAAIIGRELGIPAIVGTGLATKVLKTGQEITVDCTLGSVGRVFSGKIPFKVKKYDLEKIPELPTKIMVNIGAPDIAFKTSFLPNEGVGLARIEFILAEKIKVHPLALCHFEKLKNQISKIKNSTQKSELKKIVKTIEEITIEHKDKKEHFYKELAEGVAQIAAAFWPHPVIVRFSDFKTNEYKKLVGGELFEPEEENPMIGWRGASRYYDPKYQPAFEMECKAIKRAREEFGLKNIWVMIPFCRTVEEGKKVLEIMRKAGLEKGKDGLKVICMCEIPSNVILAEEFLKIFDGFSIGSNDLTQLVLGLDRDSAIVAKVGDERNEAVKEMIKKTIHICNQKKKYCGICGDIPSTDVKFAQFLINCGIPSMSLSPDAVMKTIIGLSKERKKRNNLNFRK
jgi:pyruvate,water dikinase